MLDLNHLEIDRVVPCSTQVIPNGGVVIDWHADNIGFGQLAFWWDKDDKLHADTEFMSSSDNRDFLRKILELLADKIVIDE